MITRQDAIRKSPEFSVASDWMVLKVPLVWAFAPLFFICISLLFPGNLFLTTIYARSQAV